MNTLAKYLLAVVMFACALAHAQYYTNFWPQWAVGREVVDIAQKDWYSTNTNAAPVYELISTQSWTEPDLIRKLAWRHQLSQDTHELILRTTNGAVFQYSSGNYRTTWDISYETNSLGEVTVIIEPGMALLENETWYQGEWDSSYTTTTNPATISQIYWDSKANSKGQIERKWDFSGGSAIPFVGAALESELRRLEIYSGGSSGFNFDIHEWPVTYMYRTPNATIDGMSIRPYPVTTPFQINMPAPQAVGAHSPVSVKVSGWTAP